MVDIIKRDQNHKTVAAGVANGADTDVRMLKVDPTTGYLLISIGAAGAAANSGAQIAKRDQNHKPVMMGWDAVNGVPKEILTDASGNLLVQFT